MRHGGYGRWRLTLLASVAAAALSGGTALADPASDFETRWNGLYVGGNLGYYRHWVDAYDEDGWFSFPGQSYSAQDSGMIGGGQAGYNVQWGHLVFGVEGDFDLTAGNSGFAEYSLGDFERVVVRSQMRDLATFRARFGYAFDSTPLLVYGTGGMALGNLNDSVTDATPGDNAVWSKKGWKSGWTVGGGLEYALDRNWSLKAEILYVDFGTGTVSTTPLVRGKSKSGILGFKIRDQAVIERFGINYRF